MRQTGVGLRQGTQAKGVACSSDPERLEISCLNGCRVPVGDEKQVGTRGLVSTGHRRWGRQVKWLGSEWS